MNLSSIMRPSVLADVIGNEGTVSTLEAQLIAGTLPQTIMITGGFGQGKTTLGRIIASELKAEVSEVDCGSNTGVDVARQLVDAAHLTSLFNTSKVFILDEVHKLSTAAQSALLKTLEDAPKNVYFILLTDQPNKVLKTVYSRCVVYTMKPATNADVGEAVRRVQEKYGVEFENKADFWEVIRLANGSLRVVYALLEKLIAAADENGLVSSEAFMDAIGVEEEEEIDVNVPKAFISKDIPSALNALNEERKSGKQVVGTVTGIYNYMRKGWLSGWFKDSSLKPLMADLASMSKDASWTDVEALIWRHF